MPLAAGGVGGGGDRGSQWRLDRRRRPGRLDRFLRDVHTAGAHVWVAPDTYELAGRLLLGPDPGSPNI